MELTRKQVIDNLSYIADSMPDDACAEWRDSLAYAISSLKTDEAYQIMYEGGEIYTKDEVIAMFKESKQDLIAESYGIETDCSDYVVNVADIDKVIQEKINALKENEA